MVTSETRLKAPWDIIQFATDGVHSIVSLNLASGEKTLGGWEEGIAIQAVYVKPGISAIKKGENDYSGKSRGVSIQSILGEGPDQEPKVLVTEDEDEEDEKDDRDQRWFEYLDDACENHWSRGERTLVCPHTRLVTFGAAAFYEDVWPIAGCWVEGERKIDLNDAGVKRTIEPRMGKATKMKRLWTTTK